MKWIEEVKSSGGMSIIKCSFYPTYLINILSSSNQLDAPANFISDIFYLMTAVTHYGLVHALHTVDDLHKNLGEMQRHVDYLNGTLAGINVREFI